MDISAHLEQLRMAFCECHAIAYADLGTQMILVTSAAAEMPQERWDDLCDTGVALLSGEPAQNAGRAIVNGAEISHAVILEAGELGLFLRSETNLEDVIFCVSRPSLPVSDFIEKASRVLDRIAQDG